MSAAVQKDPAVMASKQLLGAGRVYLTPRMMRRLRKNVNRATAKGLIR